MIKRIYKKMEIYPNKTFWVYWHDPSSFIPDAIQLVIKKKDSICNEIEFYLDLRIHYQFRGYIPTTL